jgi:hypothetical protein
MNIDVHDKWNKAREGTTKEMNHNSSHLKEYVIDFNDRHMKPKGREIFITSTKTSLYPALRLWDFENGH